MVHANAMPFMLNAGWEYSRRHGSGLVSVPHANVGEKYRRVEALHYFTGCQKRVLRESSFVVAQSRFEACLYREMGIPEERIHISGSGISPNEFRDISGERGRRRHGLDGRVVLCLTAHSVQRGTGHLLKASEILKNRGTEHTLVLAGPVMDDAQELLNDFVPPGAGDDPVVTGYIRQSERLDLIAAADAVVLPSRLDCFGIVLLEAWMLGKPVVGCWSGAMPDLIREGENGYLVPWGDPETLAHRTGLLLKNVEAARNMGERGREQVLKKWTWKRITDDFYRRLAHCFSGGAGS